MGTPSQLPDPRAVSRVQRSRILLADEDVSRSRKRGAADRLFATRGRDAFELLPHFETRGEFTVVRVQSETDDKDPVRELRLVVKIWSRSSDEQQAVGEFFGVSDFASVRFGKAVGETFLEKSDPDQSHVWASGRKTM